MLTTLPVELVLSVLDYLKPTVPSGPTTGSTAIWTKLCRECPALADGSPLSNEEPWLMAAQLRKGKDDHDAGSPLWKVRMTCKYLHELCNSILLSNLQQVNLFDGDPEPSLCGPLSLGRHMTTLRVLVDPESGIFRDDHNQEIQENVAKLISSSPNLTSVALYYRSGHAKIGPIADAIVQVMSRGALRSLGVYSAFMIQRESTDDYSKISTPNTLEELFAAILRVPGAADSLIELDIAVPSLLFPHYSFIRRSFSSLERFSVRSAFRTHLGRLWDENTRAGWAPKRNLTHLTLIDCLSAYAADVPGLVGLFESLTHLVVSTCGSFEDMPPPPRKPGWSTDSPALCKSRKRLEELHIEHMADWEIGALGVIPAKRVILSNVRRHSFVQAFRVDDEIFPGLQVLSVYPGFLRSWRETAQVEPVSEAETMDRMTLEQLCKPREIEVAYDAHVIRAGLGLFGIA